MFLTVSGLKCPASVMNVPKDELCAISLETSDAQHRLSCMHYEEFDPTDYSVVVKLRGNPPKPWKWEIYRACRSGPLESSTVFFESAGVATKEGKKVLARLLAKAKHAA